MEFFTEPTTYLVKNTAWKCGEESCYAWPGVKPGKHQKTYHWPCLQIGCKGPFFSGVLPVVVVLKVFSSKRCLHKCTFVELIQKLLHSSFSILQSACWPWSISRPGISAWEQSGEHDLTLSVRASCCWLTMLSCCDAVLELKSPGSRCFQGKAEMSWLHSGLIIEHCVCGKGLWKDCCKSPYSSCTAIVVAEWCTKFNL